MCTFRGKTQVLTDSIQDEGELFGSVVITGSNWDGYAECDENWICEPPASLQVHLRSRVEFPFLIENSTVTHTRFVVPVYVRGNDERKISVHNSHFSSGKMKTPGGLNLKIQYFSGYTHNLLIHIENSSFTDLSYGILPVTDSMTKATALSIKVISYPYYGRNTDIQIKNCTFQNNHKPLRVFGLPVDNFPLSNCLFRNNHLFEGIGAALYLALASRFSRTQSLM